MQDYREAVGADIHRVPGAGTQMLNAALTRFGVTHEHAEIEAHIESRVYSGRLPAVFRINWHDRDSFCWLLVLADGLEPDIVFLDFAVKPRPINAQQVRRFLFVSTGALQSALNDKLFNVFECHVRWHVPGKR